MEKKNYHLLRGLTCLGISVPLPTIIYYSTIRLLGSGEIIFLNQVFRETAAQALMGILLLLATGVIFVAVKDLGNYMISLMNTNEFQE
jgi:hypothetical protein